MRLPQIERYVCNCIAGAKVGIIFKLTTTSWKIIKQTPSVLSNPHGELTEKISQT